MWTNLIFKAVKFCVFGSFYCIFHCKVVVSALFSGVPF